MYINRTSWIVILSCLALSSLIFFQVNWLRHSRNLIEEQFDQKVTMALCSVVEIMGRNTPEGEGASVELLCKEDGLDCGDGYLQTSLSNEEVQQLLETTMQRYNIHLDFEFEILSEPAFIANPLNVAAYTCQLLPVSQEAKQIMKINFLGKEAYIIHKMGFMATASILILLFVGLVFVLTLYKLLRQQRLNRMSIDFFNSMAHEFRTPLTNIRLALNLSRRQGDPAKATYLDIIKSENDRLLEQVERMLHVAKLEKGEFVLETQEVQLKPFLQEIVQEMEISVAEKGGTIELLETGSPPLIIKGDQLHLGNAFRNLIDNAVKYCDRAPFISVKMNQKQEYAKLSFEDNGVGMNEQQKQQAFEKFYRVQNEDTPLNKGFGLGLAYVKKIVELHKGFLQLESKPQSGSTFHIFLPLKG